MKRDLVAELKSLRLHGMAQRLEELQTEGGVGIQSAGWLIASLLESESTDRHVRSIRYQMGAARFPVHRDLASFDFTKSKVDEPSSPMRRPTSSWSVVRGLARPTWRPP
jgi:uncharacterized protein YdbL (DUF1318 family)